MGDKCYYCSRNFYCNKNVCEIEIKEREKEYYLKETDEQVYKINSSYSMLNAIMKHQKYLIINGLIKKTEEIKDK